MWRVTFSFNQREEIFMTKIEAEKRLQEIQMAIDQSAANHNVLIGRREEIKHVLQIIFQEEVSEVKDSEVIENAA